MLERVQTAVVGGGVVGLAVARALSRSGREVLLLESESLTGSGTSSRNSEVVHAGIYYTAGSLKARACVEGRRALYSFCEAYAVPYSRCGKLLVATEEGELAQLDAVAEKARANGLSGSGEALVRLTSAEAVRLEPEVRCVGALHSPSTGIVDSHALMTALLADAERHGATLALGSSVVGGECGGSDAVAGCGAGGRVLLRTADGTQLACDEVVNCAGHGAPRLAAALGGMPRSHVPAAHFAKGTYFALSGRPSPFRGLVYPLPQQAGLGVHATVDLAGRCRFGPDVEWTSNAEDVQVDPTRAAAFYAEVRKYWPDLPDGGLVPDYAGVRPKARAESLAGCLDCCEEAACFTASRCEHR